MTCAARLAPLITELTLGLRAHHAIARSDPPLGHEPLETSAPIKRREHALGCAQAVDHTRRLLRDQRTGAGAGQRLTQSTIAPDFSLDTLDGKTMRLSDLRGKAVLLNFWATWCGPCKIEMPWFVDLQNQDGSQGLQIVGVAMDDGSKEDIAKFAKDMGVN